MSCVSGGIPCVHAPTHTALHLVETGTPGLLALLGRAECSNCSALRSVCALIPCCNPFPPMLQFDYPMLQYTHMLQSIPIHFHLFLHVVLAPPPPPPPTQHTHKHCTVNLPTCARTPPCLQLPSTALLRSTGRSRGWISCHLSYS